MFVVRACFCVLLWYLNVRVYLVLVWCLFVFVLCLFVLDCMCISSEFELVDCVYCACSFLCVTLLFESACLFDVSLSFA